ncbi:MAG: DUF1329 domain-containing protein [Xanthomonadales bacterium]|nr:DUF1329 domain-containing protein [Xanthomonadales bacterium]
MIQTSISKNETSAVFFSVILGLLASSALQAGAMPDQVERLSRDLTPVGAERGANEAGTIPAWTGGITEPPASYRQGDHHPDPFAGEQPLLRIDSGNLNQHREQLGNGQAALLAKYPEFYLEVYPSHRTAAYPERVYEMTAQNAASGSLSENGNAVINVAEGFPFPFPENAQELIWNHQLRYRGTGSIRHIKMIAPTANGAFNEITMTVTTTNPYYHRGATLDIIDNHFTMYEREVTTPPSMAGNVLLVYESLNQVAEPRKAWVYNPGRRRVIRAPNVAYDSPSAGTDGMHVSDMTDMFNGALDRYQWELKGKREMYVPYNAYRLHSSELDYDDLVLPGHLDPRHLRYELHRVWVVEATLRNGSRHINPKRIFYLDEDSYQILMVDHYNSDTELWRYSEAHPINFYDVPTLWTTLEVHYDLEARRYAAFRLDPGKPIPPFNMELDPGDFTPQALRRKGRR